MDPFEKISHSVDTLFGTGVSKNIPKDIDFKMSKKTGRIRAVYITVCCYLLQGQMVELQCRFIAQNCFQKIRNSSMTIA